VVILKFSMTIALADKPGQLLKALEPIAKNGGNIISIVHERDKLVEGYVPVSVVVDFPLRENYMNAVNELKNLGIVVVTSSEIVEKVRLTLILTGNVNLLEVVKSKIRDAEIISLETSTIKPNEVSFKLEAEVSVHGVHKFVEELKKIASEQDALLILPFHL